MKSAFHQFDRDRRRFDNKTKLYWAYGSNLCMSQMAERCPGARKLKALPVYGCKLVFRSVADVEETGEPSDVCLGGLWRITEQDEHHLDRYEGLKSGMYEKHRFYLRDKSRHYHAVIYYKMTSKGVFPPSEAYLASIVEGYRDFGLDVTKLDAALRYSWNGQNKTPDIRQRYLRHRPNLARDIDQARVPLLTTAKPPKRPASVKWASLGDKRPLGNLASSVQLDQRRSPTTTSIKFHQPSWPSIGPHSKMLPNPNNPLKSGIICHGCRTPVLPGQTRYSQYEPKEYWHWNCHLASLPSVNKVKQPPRRQSDPEQAKLQQSLARAEKRPAKYELLTPEEQKAIDEALEKGNTE